MDCLNHDLLDSRITLILHPFSSSCSSLNPANPGSDFRWIPACAGMTAKGVVQGTAVIPDKGDEGGRDPESRITGETPMLRSARNWKGGTKGGTGVSPVDRLSEP